MRKTERKLAGIMLMAAMLFMLLPGSTAMAGQTETDAFDNAAEAYGTASGTFWSAMDAYNGVWDESGNCTSVGAYDAYVAAAESGAGNADTLYATAQSARTDCTNTWSQLQTKYNDLMTAYDSLSVDEKTAERESAKTDLAADYTNAGICANELAELLPAQTYAARKNFFDAMDSYDTALNRYWNSMNAYYGADETAQGSFGNYMDALYSGAVNVQELYTAAGTDRANCVSAFEGLVPLYNAAAAAYDALADADKADSDIQEAKANLESSYADAVQANNELDVLVAPEEFVPDMGELSSIWIDANGNFGGVPQAPAYWKVSETGKIVAATENDWSLKYEKNAAGVTLTLRNFRFTSIPTDGETELDAIWSDTSLILNLEGSNSITGTRGGAIGVERDLTINGPGGLELYSTASEAVSAGGETYVPTALYVSGTLTNNGATLRVSSNNPENTVWAKDIINTGYILPAEGQVISKDGAVYTKLEPSEEGKYGEVTAQQSGTTGAAQPAQIVSPMTGENFTAAAGVMAVMGAAVVALLMFGKRKVS